MSNNGPGTIGSRPFHPASPGATGDSWVAAEPTRTRQTEKPDGGLRRFALATANVLVSGVQTGLDLVGAPRMAAAVRGAAVAAPAAALGASSTDPAGAALAGAAAAGLPGGTDVDRAYQMQRESQAFNLQLLELQEQVQQDNRQFTTLTNVMRAKHDTAKAALSNIRS
jgi:hypothetical protein